MDFDPKNPQEYIQAQKKGKPAMMFAGLDKIKDPETGALLAQPRCHCAHTTARPRSVLRAQSSWSTLAAILYTLAHMHARTLWRTARAGGTRHGAGVSTHASCQASARKPAACAAAEAESNVG